MPPSEAWTDDHVAEILKREAQANLATSSLTGLFNRRPTGSAPKPNTRFLRNILRDTDNHNSALLAKEAEESRARQRRLREQERNKGKPEQQLYSARARHDGNAERPVKRRRLSDDDDTHHSKRRSRHEDSSSRRSTEQRTERGHDRKTGLSTGHGSGSDHDRDDHRRRDRRHASHRRRSDRSESPGRRIKDGRGGRDHHSYRSRSREGDRSDRRRRRTKASSSPEPDKSRGESSRRAEDVRGKRIPWPRAGSPASDSDPLETIIGPRPPPSQPAVRSRGRGTFNRASAIDDHFAETYDPSADVQPDEAEEDDWEQALEAMRDRQKWKQRQGDRLRAAGFTDDEVRKWEKGGEKAEEDVRWSKKGEGREWDRGKVVGDDGMIDVKAEWGRLKGT